MHVINEDERNDKQLTKFFIPSTIETLVWISFRILLQNANGT